MENSQAYYLIQDLMEHFDFDNGNEFELSKQVQKIYIDNGKPEDCRDQYALALAYMGQSWYYGWDGHTENEQMAFLLLLSAYTEGNRDILEELGLCYYNGASTPTGTPEPEKALAIWKEGMELGNKDCAFHCCVDKVDNNDVDQETLDTLEALATDPEEPIANASAVLYYYYEQEGDMEKAEKWHKLGQEQGSSLIQDWDEEEKPRPSTDMSMFFGADEDDDDDDDYEKPEPHPGYPEVGEKYVIIADTDDDFRIVQADAADWRSLPALIGAERCDDMRCTKFREVAGKLGLPGTLLGQLDKDAFRKPGLPLNYHASQWYDGMADLAGDMVICLEDAKYNPFSFTSKEQAQSVIDALCNKN